MIGCSDDSALSLKKANKAGGKQLWNWRIAFPLVLILIACIWAGVANTSFGALELLRVNAAKPSRVDATTSAEGVATGAQIAVTALGRLEPLGEIAHVSVPAFLKDERVTEVFVKQGAWVKRGQVLCALEARTRLLSSLREAQSAVRVADAKLSKIKAGAKLGEIEAQKAAIANVQYELNNKLLAQDVLIGRVKNELDFNVDEAKRYQNLHQSGAISTSQYDSKQTLMRSSRALLSEAVSERKRLEETLTARVAESKYTLSKIAEVRDVDVSVAIAELEEAMAKLTRVRTDLDLASVRSSQDGRILKLNVRPGEIVTEKGIADIGLTSEMVVVADVHQSDIDKVTIGQRAEISSATFEKKIHGSVKSIGWQVQRQSVYAQDPSASSDARVIEVKIFIDKPDRKFVQGLTNLQVEVAIACAGAKALTQSPSQL